jgi:pyruvate dehydrogenase (quinone)
LLTVLISNRGDSTEQAKIAQVDVRPEALGNRCSLHLGLLGNVKDTLDAVLPSIKEKTDSSHLSEAR